MIIVDKLATRNPLDLNTRKRLPLISYGVLPKIKGGIEVVCEPHQMRKLWKPDAACEESEDRKIEAPESETVQ